MNMTKRNTINSHLIQKSGEGRNRKNGLKRKKIIFAFILTILITILNINGLNIKKMKLIRSSRKGPQSRLFVRKALINILTYITQYFKIRCYIM